MTICTLAFSFPDFKLGHHVFPKRKTLVHYRITTTNLEIIIDEIISSNFLIMSLTVGENKRAFSCHVSATSPIWNISVVSILLSNC